jgi:PRTRC genetic system protein B
MTQTMQNSALGLAVAGAEPLGAECKQDLKLHVDVFSESVVLTRFEEGAATATYEVAPEDLAAAFAGIPVATGLLPKDCLFFARRGSQDYIAIYIPPGRRTLSVKPSKRAVTIRPVLPALVFAGEGIEYRVYAVKQRPSEPAESLFHAPFPNVYNDGRICPGNVTFPVCSTGTIHQAAALFLESNFNHDLAAGKCNSHDNVVNLWRALAKRNARNFPASELIGTRHTLGDLLGE